MGRKIAILGKAPDSLKDAPLEDPTWELWTINDSVYREQIKTSAKHFELHPIEWTKDKAYDQYYDWLKSTEIPVVLREAVPEVKSGSAYPREEVFAHFAGVGSHYFTNSISYMVALAIYELDQEDQETKPIIGLWGVNMAQHGTGGKSEYAMQRPSCEFWAGVAKGRGYGLELSKNSDLLKTASLYGFDFGGELHTKMQARDAELQQRISAAQHMEAKAHDENVFLQGALECNAYWKQWFTAQGDNQ